MCDEQYTRTTQAAQTFLSCVLRFLFLGSQSRLIETLSLVQRVATRTDRGAAAGP